VVTAVVALAIIAGGILYLVRIGKKLETVGGLRTALGIHGKINKIRTKLRAEKEKEIAKLEPNNPRRFFSSRK
jgi:hypothetical protein